MSSVNPDISGRIAKFNELYVTDIKNLTGGNYFATWSPLKTYKVGDTVFYDDQIFICVVENTNVAPDPDNFSQSEWQIFTSSGSAPNKNFVTVSNVDGDDTKAAQGTGVPFATILGPTGALEYLKTIGGGTAKVITVGQNNFYGVGGGVTVSSVNNIVLDGGDENDGIVPNPKNTILNYLNIQDTTDFTMKNISLRNTLSGEYMRTTSSRNLTFENLRMDDEVGISGYIYIGSRAGETFGSHSFINCKILPIDSSSFTIWADGTCEPNTVFLIDNGGLPYRSVFSINTTGFGGVDNPADFTLIVRNSVVDLTNVTHRDGMRMIVQNCIIRGSLNSTATSGTLAVIGCSLYDPTTALWATVNLTGSASYFFVDTLFNPATNPSIPTTAINITSGPASKFNRFASYTGAAAVALPSNTIVNIPLGTLSSNLFNIVSNGTVADSFNILSAGNYNITIKLTIDNTSTATDVTATNLWIGSSTSDETTGTDVIRFTRSLVAGTLLATFPTSRMVLNTFIPSISGVVTDRFLRARNVGLTSFNVTLVSLIIEQSR